MMRQLFLFLGWMIIACRLSVAATIIEKEVTFKGAKGATLAGTLELPTVDKPVPAFVLVAGSGPTDRNGNQPPRLTTDLLKQIAAGLADKGIATLRFDKRGMDANASEMPKDKSQLGHFFCWENFVGDVSGAYRFLEQQPTVDASHVGILGHSEGGMLALQAAHDLQSNDHPPAVLILLSTPGRPFDVVLAEQLTRLLKRQNASPQQTDYFLSENKRIDQSIRETGKVPADVPAGLAALYPGYLGEFLHSEFAVNPVTLAAEFANPVLVVSGAADIQVSSERDAKALDAALATRKNEMHTLFIVDRASHNLKVVTGEADPGFAGAISPVALDELQRWAGEHLAR